MYNLRQFMSVIEVYAPLEISYNAIKEGDYDNSGIIVNNHDKVENVLFSLDLSKATVEYAKQVGADTVVTHHPAIYNPIKSLDIEGETAPLLEAIKEGINVISMHLNLDMAESGIDYQLSCALGAKESKILFPQSQGVGYGRQFIMSTVAKDFKNHAMQALGSDKIILYGEEVKINKVASFCGGGSSHALSAISKNLTNADLIVSSDMPHHVIKEIVEKGKAVLIIPHYVSEQYGFKKFYEWTLKQTDGKVKAYYFEDKRFM